MRYFIIAYVTVVAVSYTHLDVYKRQTYHCLHLFACTVGQQSAAIKLTCDRSNRELLNEWHATSSENTQTNRKTKQRLNDKQSMLPARLIGKLRNVSLLSNFINKMLFFIYVIKFIILSFNISTRGWEYWKSWDVYKRQLSVRLESPYVTYREFHQKR